jgi:hypothetical protein
VVTVQAIFPSGRCEFSRFGTNFEAALEICNSDYHRVIFKVKRKMIGVRRQAGSQSVEVNSIETIPVHQNARMPPSEGGDMRMVAVSLAFLVMCGCSRNGGRPTSETSDVAVEKTAKWISVEIPLDVNDLEIPKIRLASVTAHGFWQTASSGKDKQLAFPVVVRIRCDKYEKTCTESQATVTLGVLDANVVEYGISSWTKDGIIADDSDEGDCGIGHRLSIDFKSKSVLVTDYPKKVTSDKNCQPFQDAGSYALHGGQIMLYPPAAYDPLARVGEKR